MSALYLVQAYGADVFATDYMLTRQKIMRDLSLLALRIKSSDPNSEEKWTLDMMAAEDGKYFNTIQLIAKVI